MSKQALYEYNEVAKALNHKWSGLLEGIDDTHVRLNTAILLENENQKGTLLTEDPVFSQGGVGTFSGQTANAGGFDFSAGDGTGSGSDIAPFQHYLLPLVRRVYPNLIANELVGVQPMTSPASLVFYLKYKYTGLVNPDAVVSGSTHNQPPQRKGATEAGTEYGNFIGNTWNIDPYYSLQTIFREAVLDLSSFTHPTGVIVAADLAATEIATVATPVVENSLQVGSVGSSTMSFVVTESGGSNSATVTYTLTSFVASTGIATFGSPVVSNATAAQTGAVPTSFTITFDVTDASVTTYSGVDFTNILLGGVNVDGVSGASTNFHRTYDYNMEGNRQLPEMELQVESFPVSAKTRKLRTKWTIEASQDLRAMHNIDAEQELIAVLANEVTAEIDREIINDLIVNASIRVDYDYSSPFLVGGVVLDNGSTVSAVGPGGISGIATGATTLPAIPGVTSFDDRNKALFYQILEVSNQIYRQSLRGAGNWVVTSPEIAAKLESLLEFKPDARTDTTYNLGIQYSGTLNGQFRLYKDPLFPSTLILVGFKGTSFMDAGYFYCPYVPLQLTPTVLDTESFNPRKGLVTRYGKVLVENGDRMYGIIRVQNVTAVGANRLPGSDAVGKSPQTQGGAITNSVANTDLPISGDQTLI